MVKQIPLTQGKFALVDDEDYDFLMQWKWSVSGKYAGRGVWFGHKFKPKSKMILMHWEILGRKDGFHIDHKNHNTLDNRRSNLRHCTISQNQQNRTKSYGSNRYKGVYEYKGRNVQKKWTSAIVVNGERISLGSFLTEIEAAISYNDAAIKYFGEFSKLNLID